MDESVASTLAVVAKKMDAPTLIDKFIKTGSTFFSTGLIKSISTLHTIGMAFAFFGVLAIAAYIYYIFRYVFIIRYRPGNYKIIEDYFHSYYDDIGDSAKAIYNSYKFLEKEDARRILKENVVHVNGIDTEVKQVIDFTIDSTEVQSFVQNVDTAIDLLIRLFESNDVEMTKVIRQVFLNQTARKRSLVGDNFTITRYSVEQNFFSILAELLKLENARYMYVKQKMDIVSEVKLKSPFFDELFGKETTPPFQATSTSSCSMFTKVYLSYLSLLPQPLANEPANFITVTTYTFFKNPSSHPLWSVIAKDGGSVMSKDEYLNYIEIKTKAASLYYATIMSEETQVTEKLIRENDWDKLSDMARRKGITSMNNSQFNIVQQLKAILPNYESICASLIFAYKLTQNVKNELLTDIVKHISTIKIHRNVSRIVNTYAKPDPYLVYRNLQFWNFWINFLKTLWVDDFIGHNIKLWKDFIKFESEIWVKSEIMVNNLLPINFVQSISSVKQLIRLSPKNKDSVWKKR